MAHTHDVKSGDTLLTIAHQNAFADWRTIWDHEANAGLRGRRPDPMVLFPGDRVFVPDKTERWVRVATNQKHVFELRTPISLLKVVLTDRFGDPFRRRAWEVTVNGRLLEGRTDDRGLLECVLLPDDRDALIRLPEEEIEWQVKIGTLHPIDEVSGLQGALQCLGYYGGEITGTVDEATSTAMKTFQKQHGLTETEQPDAPTRTKLEELLFADV